MRFFHLKREEMRQLEDGAKFITIKRPSRHSIGPVPPPDEPYWAREFVGDKNRFRLAPVSALFLNSVWNVVLQKVS